MPGFFFGFSQHGMNNYLTIYTDAAVVRHGVGAGMRIILQRSCGRIVRAAVIKKMAECSTEQS